MSDGDMNHVYIKLGADLIRDDPHVATCYQRIVNGGEDVGDILLDTINALAKRAQLAEDALVAEKLKLGTKYAFPFDPGDFKERRTIRTRTRLNEPDVREKIARAVSAANEANAEMRATEKNGEHVQKWGTTANEGLVRVPGKIAAGDLVRVDECCKCQGCAHYLGKLARVRGLVGAEAMWAHLADRNLLRLELYDHFSPCCFEAAKVTRVFPFDSNHKSYPPDGKAPLGPPPSDKKA